MTEQDNTASSEDEDQSSQLYGLANSIIEECKGAAPLSDLDTAIYLFGEALDRCPAPHPYRSDTLKDLTAALVTRFSLTKQREDLDQAILLHGEIVEEPCNALTRTEGPCQSNVRVRLVPPLTFELTIPAEYIL